MTYAHGAPRTFWRDILNRVLRGAPLALAVGVFSVAGGGLAGCALGLTAGYYRGKIGTAIAQQHLRSILAFCNSPLMNSVEAYVQF